MSCSELCKLIGYVNWNHRLELINFCFICEKTEVAYHCLYGFTDEHWEVKVPDDQFVLGFPHPKPVTYLDRHLKGENNWLAHVSLQSESWLYSIAHYYIAELGIDAKDWYVIYCYLYFHTYTLQKYQKNTNFQLSSTFFFFL